MEDVYYFNHFYKFSMNKSKVMISKFVEFVEFVYTVMVLH